MVVFVFAASFIYEIWKCFGVYISENFFGGVWREFHFHIYKLLGSFFTHFSCPINVYTYFGSFSCSFIISQMWAFVIHFRSHKGTERNTI